MSERDWSRAEPVAKELYAAYPESDMALDLLEGIYIREKKTAEAKALLRARIESDPENPGARRLLANALGEEGAFTDAADLFLKIAESPQGNTLDWNQYGWFSLLGDRTGRDVIERLEKAFDQNTNIAGFLHTLASVYAEAGQPAEARQTVLRAMNAWMILEPNSECWYVFGRIAEQYGIDDAALAYYGKVQAPKVNPDNPISTYSLARKRIAAIKARGATSKAAG
jgi:predicted Zn-dependent protease